MATYYLDTSALVKQYVTEPGTAWVRSLTDTAAGHTIYTGLLTGPELIAALFRKVRNGEILSADARLIANDFRANWLQDYQVLEITELLVTQAMALAEQHGLRGYDAVHLATALVVNARHQVRSLPSPVFVSADIGQLRAAVAIGLLTDNPDQHP